jgi:hypothetical protein
VPYVALYNFADRKNQWAISFPTLIGDFIVNIAIQPNGKFIAAHTYAEKSYILVIKDNGDLITAH